MAPRLLRARKGPDRRTSLHDFGTDLTFPVPDPVLALLSMQDQPKGEVTRLLAAWNQGNSEVHGELWHLIYDELRGMARRQLRRERPDHTLQPTALVHEAYLKLVKQSEASFEDRSHFFALAAKMMRNILVDHARAKASAKRGSGVPDLPLDDALGVGGYRPKDLVAIDDALKDLEAMDPQLCSIVELRFFVGLSNQEIGDILQCSEKTVRRHWKIAKGMLHRELGTLSS